MDAAQAAEGNFVLESDSIDGPWRGPFWIEGAEGIDPDIFEDEDGNVYWTQTRPAVNPQWEGKLRSGLDASIRRPGPLSMMGVRRERARRYSGVDTVWRRYGLKRRISIAWRLCVFDDR